MGKMKANKIGEYKFEDLLETNLKNKEFREEYDALDEYYTKNPPKVDPTKKGGIFTRQRELLDVLDQVSADGIITRALSAQKMPAQIIGEMVREKIAASV
jgi:hypothetical protein